MGKECLKCGYVRSDVDSAPDYECPQCGVVYEKYEALLKRQAENDGATDKEGAVSLDQRTRRPSWVRCKKWGCRKPVLRGTKHCPHCGTENPKLENLKVVAAIVLMGIFTPLAMTKWDVDRSTPGKAYRKSDAWFACTEYVRRDLRNPGSAEFPSYYRTSISSFGAGAYNIRAWVERQNLFGATVRNRLVCSVKYMEDIGWVVLSVKFY